MVFGLHCNELGVYMLCFCGRVKIDELAIKCGQYGVVSGNELALGAP